MKIVKLTVIQDKPEEKQTDLKKIKKKKELKKHLKTYGNKVNQIDYAIISVGYRVNSKRATQFYNYT